MKIGITTPTGHIGSRLVNNLIKNNASNLVLIARNPSKLTDAKSKGATVVKADMLDKKAMIKATRGLDTLFWVNPPKLDTHNFTEYYVTLANTGVETVKKNGINRVVLLSSVGAHQDHGLGPVSALHKVEDIFRDSVKNLTILRPTYFMDNLLSTVGDIKRNGQIHLPVDGHTRVPMVASDDIARVAADLLTQDFTGYHVHSLHGPRDYTFDEVADIIGKTVGKKVEYVHVTPQQAIESMEENGVSDEVAHEFVEMYEAMDTGRFYDETPRSSETTTPTTLETYVKTNIAPAIAG
jgi:uncharacterized protein YbjT (DUF2867 family)